MSPFFFTYSIYNKNKIMLKEIVIKLKEEEFIVKRSNRALMYYEEYTKKSIDEITGTITDMLTIFYCSLVVNNKHFNYSFDEFVDLTDDYPEAFEAFQNYLINLSLDVFSDQEFPDKKKIEKNLE